MTHEKWWERWPMWRVAPICVAVAIALAAIIFRLLRTATPRPGDVLELIKTTITVAGFVGAVLVGVYGYRKQRLAEGDAHRADAEQLAQRYTTAADQLGHEKAAVRLAGVYAMARLADDWVEQRQICIDVLCAYLRMPYTAPEEEPPVEDAPTEVRTCYEERRQELQVRLTAQRILGAHLRPEAADIFWPGIDLDLTQAYLHTLDLTHCRLGTALFNGARFSGEAKFTGARFVGDAQFNGARFSGDAIFNSARFSGDAQFREARFCGDAHFDGRVRFAGNAHFKDARLVGRWTVFNGAHFDGEAEFTGARFGTDALFQVAHFSRLGACFSKARFDNVKFDRAEFTGYASFDEAEFAGYTRLVEEQFSEGASFDRARVPSGSRTQLPAGWTTRDARTAEGEKEGWMYITRIEDGDEQPEGEDRKR